MKILATLPFLILLSACGVGRGGDIESQMRQIFASRPSEWRNIRSLRGGLHELKVSDSLVRIFFWIGPGGLRVIEACEDPKHDSDYEVCDYNRIRRQVRAPTE